ncbi:MAG: hypothetical protein A2896_01140 [Candidatus Nealsonbacteria bacterium RIFCSPLOWO2_01_FULL_43_32]|uniref:Uncharacterized protein n=1 Tax=Candidatus Nealsonbacteria bacterium RIFCSPLOWO2_01_FULL_43_32 TaxID=1801672 RepID=A0A1G2EGD9_9BACT|nr:MAG: hypothetical protein A2896_01140 [Candidatus Nealsonbacteria bacterium RIFCSPLOWO2_01_FULL_43_32]
MTNFLKKLQQKPKSVKQTIMWLGVILIMTAIFVGWFMTFSFDTSLPPEDEKTAQLKRDVPSVWKGLKSQINTLMATIRNL